MGKCPYVIAAFNGDAARQAYRFTLHPRAGAVWPMRSEKNTKNKENHDEKTFLRHPVRRDPVP